jgi:UDP-N-acetylmuramate dehydrogenase
MASAAAGTPVHSGYTLAEHAPLAAHTTFGVPAQARRLVTLHHADALPGVLAHPDLMQGPLLVLGQGSNVLFTRDWPGTVLQVRTRGIRVLDEDGGGTRVRVEAGESWDDFVGWSLAQCLCGLENLVAIPGTVGAAPIQNIGAYGSEVGEFIESIEAHDLTTGAACRLDRAACRFGYRDSLFKHTRGRYVIAAVTFLLPRTRALRTGYPGVQEELAALGAGEVTPARVAMAIRRVRGRKLPDPARTGNAGSFFKNPHVSQDEAAALQQAHPGMPAWPTPDGRVKLSAAWLVEACEFKGLQEGAAAVSAQHALVLVNLGGASGAQVWALAGRIRDGVEARFGVVLEPEPQIL